MAFSLEIHFPELQSILAALRPMIRNSYEDVSFSLRNRKQVF